MFWNSWIGDRGAGRTRQLAVCTTANLHRLINNVIYLGQVKHQGTLYPGEQEAIINESLWNQVHDILQQNSPEKRNLQRNKHGALLKGLVLCAHCNTQMFHTYSQKGNRRYRYYVCTAAQKQGYEICPSRSVPAMEMEHFVIEKIRMIGVLPVSVREKY